MSPNVSNRFMTDDEIEAIGRGLFDRTLPKARWTHRGHFAAALYVICRRTDLEAEIAMPPAIRAYNESTGVANSDIGGYHETITQASIRAARAFARDRTTTLFETCNALMDSSLGKSDWLLAYWSPDVLFSKPARKAWVESDFAQFPF